MKVHPIYDTIEKVWATDDGITASTLRELQRKLPGVTILDYYPNGYVASRSDWGTEKEVPSGFYRRELRTNYNGWSKSRSAQIAATKRFLAKARKTYEQRQTEKIETAVVAASRFRPIARIDRILELHSQGLSISIIAERVGMSDSAVTAAIHRARHAQDKRALTLTTVSRVVRQKVNWTPEIEKRLRQMVVESYTGRKIAKALGITQGAVAGYCHRNKLKLSGAKR